MSSFAKCNATAGVQGLSRRREDIKVGSHRRYKRAISRGKSCAGVGKRLQDTLATEVAE